LELRGGAWAQKVERWGYQIGEQYDVIYSRVDTIYHYDRRTLLDGRLVYTAVTH